MLNGKTVMTNATRLGALWILVALFATAASAQFYEFTRPGNEPFKNYDKSQDAAAAGLTAATGPGGPLQLKFPQAMMTAMPLKLMPPKPHLVVPAAKKKDKELGVLDAKRRAVLGQLKEARKRQDHVAVSNAVRSLESLRQQRLARLRKIAERVKPVVEESGGPTVAGPDGKTPKPVLPIPTLPPKKK